MGWELVHRSRDGVVESLAPGDVGWEQTPFQHLHGGTWVSPFPSLGLSFPIQDLDDGYAWSNSEGSSVLCKFPVDPY